MLFGAYIDFDSVRVGTIVFSSSAVVEFHLNAYTSKYDIYDALDSIPYVYGSANMQGALNIAIKQMFTPENGDRPDTDNVIVLITDSISNVDTQNTIP